MVSVLFVGSRNTCRSIAAEAVFSYLVNQVNSPVAVGSAGIRARPGQPADAGLRKAAELRAYDLSGLYSKLLEEDHYKKFDYLLAVDHATLIYLRTRPHASITLRLLMHYAQFFSGDEVAYPKTEKVRSFSRIFDYVEDACLGLLHHIQCGRNPVRNRQACL